MKRGGCKLGGCKTGAVNGQKGGGGGVVSSQCPLSAPPGSDICHQGVRLATHPEGGVGGGGGGGGGQDPPCPPPFGGNNECIHSLHCVYSITMY